MLIGVDLVRQSELAALLGRSWFLRYTYAPEELAIADTFGADRAAEFLTGRFAAKEAVLKVIGTGVAEGVRLCQVAVVRAESGAPLVRLSGMARARARDRGIAQINVSIAHKQGLIFAAAVGVSGE